MARVLVLVLGDIGRSPRMQYHAMSLADAGFHVTLMGYGGSDVMRGVVQRDTITCRYMPSPPAAPRRCPAALWLPIKLAWLCCVLAWYMWVQVGRSVSLVLLQNPPGLPVLPFVAPLCWLGGTKLVIDWHNYGWSLLRWPPPSLVGRMTRWLEMRWACALSHAHLCVTHAMAADLAQSWAIPGVAVLHDQPPPDLFRPLTSHEGVAALARMRPELAQGASAVSSAHDDDHANDPVQHLLGLGPDGDWSWREDGRAALVVSSTSWTPDEDFGVLLAAVEAYDAMVEQEERLQDSLGAPLAPLVLVITGKGPQRSAYEARMRSMHLRHVCIVTTYLSYDNYAAILGAADVGISLHTSSSGLDLPMKVVDMFGCGLPVCAMNFSCIGELVHHEQDGLLFETPAELCACLVSLLRGFPAHSALLQQLRDGIHTLPWEQQWNEVALPIMQRLVPHVQ